MIMNWEIKIKLTLLTVVVLTVIYIVNEGPVVYEGQAIVEQENTTISPADMTTVTNLKFTPKIVTEATVLSYLSVRAAGQGFLIYPSAFPLTVRSLVDDYQFSGFDQLDLLTKSSCGLRETSYVSRSGADKNEHEFVRLFWRCDGGCLAIVSEILPQARDSAPHLGRHIKIEMPTKLCESLWNKDQTAQKEKLK